MPHRILLADDSLTIRKVIELTFSGTEFELKAVGNGDEALPLLDSFLPDIVLADCVIPGKTGYELCEEVKRRPGGRFVPVVLLTGTFEPFDKPRAERAGADSFVTKPFDSQGLASLVRGLVTRAAEERAAAPPEPPPAPETPSPPPVEETEESAEPTLSGQEPFLTVSMGETQELQPLPEEDPYTTMMIPVFRNREIAPSPSYKEIAPPYEEIAPPPPPDPPTQPIVYRASEPSPAPYEMGLGALDDEPPHRDLEADIAAFEASGRSATRPDLWDSPAANAAAADLSPEHAPGDLEALAAEASLTDLKSLIPQASALAAPAAGLLSDDDIDRIAHRVLELSGERIVRKIAWDVVPELAERLVKERLEELDRTD
jgi:CheY-like chemotaxis protein